MKQIVIERRPSDIMAFLEGHREIWGCGSSQAEAIGDLIYTHQQNFEIEITVQEN